MRSIPNSRDGKVKTNEVDETEMCYNMNMGTSAVLK